MMTQLSASALRSPVIERHPDAVAAALAVAHLIAATIRARPTTVLGLATGNSPEVVYAELVRLHREEGLSFAGVTTFNLDEYVGIGPDHPGSYRAYMQTHLFDHVDVVPARTHVPDGVAADLDAAAAGYEADLRAAGGIDLQLLGIGRNGHIGFNEPGADPAGRTGIVRLHPSTLAANAAVFPGGHVPERALTMGIGTILESRAIVVLATGPLKADAVKMALTGPVTPACPASLLGRHPSVTWHLDTEAAAAL
jgi:glucosamine-6-phosphate deaminase